MRDVKAEDRESRQVREYECGHRKSCTAEARMDFSMRMSVGIAEW